MAEQCRLCNSFAVNPNTGDRKGVKRDKDLCDVCFWKVAYLEKEAELARLNVEMKVSIDKLDELIKQLEIVSHARSIQ